MYEKIFPSAPYIIVVVAFILRFIYQAPYLEDWDSVQFALGIHNYSIADHQPHPPGYPLYILLGKLFYIVFQDDLKALNFMSAFLGSLIIIPLYFLTKKMFNPTTAFITILFFIFLPLPWILSTVALTDIPGLFFLLLAIYFIYISSDNGKRFLLTCFFSGLILGFRTNSILILLALICFIIARRYNLKFAFLSAFSFSAGIAVWFIPINLITGPKQFLNSYLLMKDYVISHDVLIGNSSGLNSIIKLKVEQFWDLLTIAYTSWFSIISTVSLGYLFFKKKLWGQFKYQFLSIWIIAHLIPQFIVYNLEMPRHTLPLLPPILILVSSVISQLLNKSLIFIIPISLLLITIILQGWSQVLRFNQQIPPTIQPILFVKKNFDPQNTIIIVSLTYRQFQYYAPEYKTYNSNSVSQVDISSEKTAIIDYPSLQNKINPSANFKITESYEFKGDEDIFPRVPKTNLYILKWQDDKQ